MTAQEIKGRYLNVSIIYKSIHPGKKIILYHYLTSHLHQNPPYWVSYEESQSTKKKAHSGCSQSGTTPTCGLHSSQQDLEQWMNRYAWCLQVSAIIFAIFSFALLLGQIYWQLSKADKV